MGTLDRNEYCEHFYPEQSFPIEFLSENSHLYLHSGIASTSLITGSSCLITIVSNAPVVALPPMNLNSCVIVIAAPSVEFGDSNFQGVEIIMVEATELKGNFIMEDTTISMNRPMLYVRSRTMQFPYQNPIFDTKLPCIGGKTFKFGFASGTTLSDVYFNASGMTSDICEPDEHNDNTLSGSSIALYFYGHPQDLVENVTLNVSGAWHDENEALAPPGNIWFVNPDYFGTKESYEEYFVINRYGSIASWIVYSTPPVSSQQKRIFHLPGQNAKDAKLTLCPFHDTMNTAPSNYCTVVSDNVALSITMDARFDVKYHLPYAITGVVVLTSIVSEKPNSTMNILCQSGQTKYIYLGCLLDQCESEEGFYVRNTIVWVDCPGLTIKFPKTLRLDTAAWTIESPNVRHLILHYGTYPSFDLTLYPDLEAITLEESATLHMPCTENLFTSLQIFVKGYSKLYFEDGCTPSPSPRSFDGVVIVMSDKAEVTFGLDTLVTASKIFCLGVGSNCIINGNLDGTLQLLVESGAVAKFSSGTTFAMLSLDGGGEVLVLRKTLVTGTLNLDGSIKLVLPTNSEMKANILSSPNDNAHRPILQLLANSLLKLSDNCYLNSVDVEILLNAKLQAHSIFVQGISLEMRSGKISAYSFESNGALMVQCNPACEFDIDATLILPTGSFFNAFGTSMHALSAPIGLATILGGHHAGCGAQDECERNNNPDSGSFGLIDAPTDQGTYYSDSSAYISKGGGAVYIKAGTITMSGIIDASAKQAETDGTARGGGAGGSIYIVAGQINFSYLQLLANGADATANGLDKTAYGGSGGRIALHVNSIQDSEIKYSVNGGLSSGVPSFGASGTFFEYYGGDKAWVNVLRPTMDYPQPSTDIYLASMTSVTDLKIKNRSLTRLLGPTLGSPYSGYICYYAPNSNQIMLDATLPTDLSLTPCATYPTMDFDSLDLQFLASTRVSQLSNDSTFAPYLLESLSNVIPDDLEPIWTNRDTILFQAIWEDDYEFEPYHLLTKGLDICNAQYPWNEETYVSFYDYPGTKFVIKESVGATIEEKPRIPDEMISDSPDSYFIPRVQSNQEVYLSYDLWVAGTGNAGNNPMPYQRVSKSPVGTMSVHLGRGKRYYFDDGRWARNLLKQHSPCNYFSDLSMSLHLDEVEWTLYGIPSPELLLLYSQDVFPHEASNPHVISIPVGEYGAVLEKDKLIPGYIYFVEINGSGKGLWQGSSATPHQSNVEIGTGHMAAFFVHFAPPFQLSMEVMWQQSLPLSPLIYLSSFPSTGASTYRDLYSFTQTDPDGSQMRMIALMLLDISIVHFLYNRRDIRAKVFESGTITIEEVLNFVTFPESECYAKLMTYEDPHPAIQIELAKSMTQALLADVFEFCSMQSELADNLVYQMVTTSSPLPMLQNMKFYYHVSQPSQTSELPNISINPVAFAVAQSGLRSLLWIGEPLIDGAIESIKIGMTELTNFGLFRDIQYITYAKDYFGYVTVESKTVYAALSETRPDPGDLSLMVESFINEALALGPGEGNTAMSSLLYMQQYLSQLMEDESYPDEKDAMLDMFQQVTSALSTLLDDMVNDDVPPDNTDVTIPLTDDLVEKAVDSVRSQTSDESITPERRRGLFDVLTRVLRLSLPKGLLTENPDIDPAIVPEFPELYIQKFLDALTDLKPGAVDSTIGSNDLDKFFNLLTQASLRNSVPPVARTATGRRGTSSPETGAFETLPDPGRDSLPHFTFAAGRYFVASEATLELPDFTDYCAPEANPQVCNRAPVITLPPGVLNGLSSSETYDVSVSYFRNTGFPETDVAPSSSEPDPIGGIKGQDPTLLQLLENAPPRDLLVSLGLSTRIMSISLLERNGNPITTNSLPTSFRFTIPFDAKISVQAKLDDLQDTVPPPLKFICPSDPDLSIGATVEIDDELLTIAKKSTVDGDFLYVLGRDCGEYLGEQRFLCRVGDLNTYEYSCPTIQTPSPVCVYWDATNNYWSQDGCTLIDFDNESFTCECDHMTNFAARFEAFAQQQTVIFSGLGLVVSGDTIYVFIAVSAILGALILGCVLTCTLDSQGFKRYRNFLMKDEEVQFLRLLYSTSGRPFILDRLLDSKLRETSTEVQPTSVRDKCIGALQASEYISPTYDPTHRTIIKNVYAATRGKTSASTTALYARMTAYFDKYRVSYNTLRGYLSLNKNSPAGHPALEQYKEIEAQHQEQSGKEVGNETNLDITNLPEEDKMFNRLYQPTTKLIEKLQQPRETLWSRIRHYWHLKNFLFRLWITRIWYSHSWVSIFSSFNAEVPRSYRLLLFAVELLGSLFLSAFFYSFEHGTDDAPLPPLTVVEILILALIVTAIQLPITWTITVLLSRGSSHRFRRRYPVIFDELRKRKLAERYLNCYSIEELKSALAKYGFSSKTSLAKEDSVFSHRASRPHNVRSLDLLKKKYNLPNSAFIPSSEEVIEETEPNQDIKVVRQTADDSDEETFYWVDPPSECVKYCPCLLRAIRRHPSQKKAYIERQKRLAPISEQKKGEKSDSFDINFLSDLLMAHSYRSDTNFELDALREFFSLPAFADELLGDGDSGPTVEQIKNEALSYIARKPNAFRKPSHLRNICYVYGTPSNVLGVLLALAYIAWSSAYLILFGLTLDSSDGKDFFSSWGISLAYSFFVSEPLVIGLVLTVQCVIFPMFYPYLVILPFVGPFLLRETTSPTDSIPNMNTLSSRLQNLTFIRAAGAAANLPPNNAAAAYGSVLAISSILFNLGQFAFSNTKSKKLAAINEEKRALIMKHYFLAQLQVARAIRESGIDKEVQ